MFKRAFQLVLVLCLVTTASWAASDSFVGYWKLNPTKSKLVDHMKVESLGGNKYEFDFGGGPETIVVDGTDQPGAFGTMLSVTTGPDSWTVVRKKADRKLLTATWTLSNDSNRLTDTYTEFGPDGAPNTVKYHYARTAAGQGFAGTWETDMPIDKSVVVQIRPYGGNGLSLVRSAGNPQNLTFDGKDHPNTGREPGSTSSARRVDERTVEITEKMNGKVTSRERLELSPDLKTLTRTVRPIDQRDPAIFVFERE